MKIVNETELMYNQKASLTLAPDIQFEALQTPSGSSLLFSLDNSGTFYCTCEVPGDTHGWTRVDLSAALIADNPGKTVTVKDFDLGQDATGNIDIVLALSVNNVDCLYISLGNQTDTWVGYTPKWTYVKFDDPINRGYASAPINDVYLASYGGNQFIFADLQTNSTTKAISRYAIDPTGQIMYNTIGVAQCWIPHMFAMTVQAGTLTSNIGCGPSDQGVNGVYTLGINNSLANTAALVYEPLFNQWAPTTSGYPTNFDLSKVSIDVNHMVMAASARSDGYTDLFFASNGVLYFIPNEQQIENNGVLPTLTPVYSHALLNGVISLHVNTWKGQVILWGESVCTNGTNTSQIFIMECPQGSETMGAAPGVNGTAWSCPIPLLFDVVNSTTYINNQYSNSVIFAHTADNGGSLVQLFQDPVTTAWQQRFLLSEPVDYITSIYESETYSTHIEITDDSNMTQPGVPVYVWASSPCSVYVSDATNTASYQTLAFDSAAAFTTDFSGNITIMQPVDSIAGISYNVAVQDPATKQWFTQVINPLKVTADNLATQVPDGSNNHLDGTVTNEQGDQTNLVSDPNVKEQQKSATSSTIYKFCQHNSDAGINKDGLTPDQGSWPDPATALDPVSTVKAAGTARPAAPRPQRLARDMRFNPAKDKIWGVTFGKDAKYYEGIDAMKEMGVTLNADNTLSIAVANGKVLGSSSWIDAKPGHLFKWMQTEFDKLGTAIMQWGEDGLDCLITIAGDVYHFVVKCMNDIAGAIHTMLNAIKTAFHDLIAWIGMLFNFQDILRTHNVMKTMISVYLDDCVQNIGSLKGDISSVFQSLITEIDPKSGMPNTPMPVSTTTYQGAMSTSSPSPGSKSPSANYGVHHLKNNGTNADHTYSPPDAGPDDSVFDDLISFIDNEGTAFADAGTKIKAIAGNITSTPIETTITEFMDAVAVLLLESAEDFLLLVADILAKLVTAGQAAITATMHVPVLTYLYKKMTTSDEYPEGEDLSVLDLGCLIASFFSTIVYKAVKGKAPFPAGPLTDAMVAAPDLPSLQEAIANFESGNVAIGPGLLGHGEASSVSVTNLVCGIDSIIGAVCIDLCIIIKSNLPNDPVPTAANTRINQVFSLIGGVGYMAYVYPDLLTSITTAKKTETNPWFDTMNNLCTYLAVVKAGIVDVSAIKWGGDTYNNLVSPILDFFLNLIWQVPTTAQYIDDFNKEKSSLINSTVEMIGGTAFDLTGILSPTLAGFCQMPNGEARTAAVNVMAGIISALNLVWGGSCLVTAVDGLPNPS